MKVFSYPVKYLSIYHMDWHKPSIHYLYVAPPTRMQGILDLTAVSASLSGVHIIQQIMGCEWDDETEKVEGFNQYGYNGEDFLTFDLETETWIAANPQAEIIKQAWDGNKASNVMLKNLLTNIYLDLLKKYFSYGRSFLQRAGRVT